MPFVKSLSGNEEGGIRQAGTGLRDGVRSTRPTGYHLLHFRSFSDDVARYEGTDGRDHRDAEAARGRSGDLWRSSEGEAISPGDRGAEGPGARSVRRMKSIWIRL